jgi:phage terminase large subunit
MQAAPGSKTSWREQAHSASQDALDTLLPTILRNPGAQCWFTANPQSTADPFSKRFITPYIKELKKNGVYEDDLHYIVMLNWRDNPWWGEEQEQLRSWDYDNISRAKYDWIWEGAFNDHIENAIIPAEWFDAAIDAHIKLGWEPLGMKVVSHDPSDKGPDDKGLCFRHGSVVLDVQEKAGLDINEGCDWALDYAITEQADHYVWDCDGIGAGLRRQTLKALSGKKMDHTEFRGGKGVDRPKEIYQRVDTHSNNKSKNNEQTFKNRRAQYYWMLRDKFYNSYLAVVKGKYIDPDEMISLSSQIQDMAALRAEVCRIPRKLNGAGLIQILSKEEMARLKIDSPNMADSLMMSYAPVATKEVASLSFASVYG